MSRSPRPQRLVLIGGVTAIAIALWILLDAAGVPLPSLARFWPIFAVLGGAASIVDFAVGTRRPASLGRGVAAIGLGALFFAFTYGAVSWKAVGTWWPALPLILGLALLATWAVSKTRNPRVLIASVVLTGLGVTGLASKIEALARLWPGPAIFWAVLLLVLGVYLVWRTLAGRKEG